MANILESNFFIHSGSRDPGGDFEYEYKFTVKDGVELMTELIAGPNKESYQLFLGVYEGCSGIDEYDFSELVDSKIEEFLSDLKGV